MKDSDGKGYIFSGITLVLCFIFLAACNGGDKRMTSEPKIIYQSIDDVPADAWKKLSEKKICFGHQSVGFNIMDGVQDIMREKAEIKLNIVEVDRFGQSPQGVWIHSRIGKNEDPVSKINDFVAKLENGIGSKADIAFMKLCYVDITAQTDVQKVFAVYQAKMAEIKKKYPDLALIHVTSPLTIIQSGFRAWIKKIIGRPLGGVKDNIARNKFNELLRKQYKGKEPILDLAEIESTAPDGTRTTFMEDNATYYALTPSYTMDRGHLNQTGRKKVAEQLLLCLVKER